LDGVTLLPKPVEPAAIDVDHLEAIYRALIATPKGTAWLASWEVRSVEALLRHLWEKLKARVNALATGHRMLSSTYVALLCKP
jgi:uridine nucleosidase